MSTVKAKPGVCGFECTITCTKNDNRKLDINLATKCPHIKKMQKDLQNIDGMEEVFGGFPKSRVYESASRNCQHLACPIPSAIVKAIEVESQLALPKDVSFEISK